MRNPILQRWEQAGSPTAQRRPGECDVVAVDTPGNAHHRYEVTASNVGGGKLWDPEKPCPSLVSRSNKPPLTSAVWSSTASGSDFRGDRYRQVMPTYLGFDGTPLHYDDLHEDRNGGEAPPVVALAGGAARHPSYLDDLAGLGDRRRLIVPHLRGVGGSPLPSAVEVASFWRQAEDIERLRVQLGLDRVLLVGHSAGTRLAISFAARFPDRLAGMVLVTPPAGYLVDEPSDAEELISRRRGEPEFDAAVAAKQAGADLEDDDAFNAWQQRVAPLGYAAWGAPERTHATFGRWSLAAARAYFSVVPPPNLAARLGEVTAPVLVVGGAEDCLTGLAPVIALAKLFPAGTTVVLERCGHYPWVEQRTAFRQAVDEFLNAASRPYPPQG